MKKLKWMLPYLWLIVLALGYKLFTEPYEEFKLWLEGGVQDL